MNRLYVKLLLFLTLALLVTVVGQGVWIYEQNQRIERIHSTELGIISGTMQDSIIDVDRFVQTKDRAALENLRVRLAYMERELYRATE